MLQKWIKFLRTCIYCASCTAAAQSIYEQFDIATIYIFAWFHAISMFNIEKKNHFNIHIMQVGPNISKKNCNFNFSIPSPPVAVLQFLFYFCEFNVWHNYCDVDDDDDFGVLMRFNVENVLYVLLIWSLSVGRTVGGWRKSHTHTHTPNLQCM